jgi:hypothetical protein
VTTMTSSNWSPLTLASCAALASNSSARSHCLVSRKAFEYIGHEFLPLSVYGSRLVSEMSSRITTVTWSRPSVSMSLRSPVEHNRWKYLQRVFWSRQLFPAGTVAAFCASPVCVEFCQTNQNECRNSGQLQVWLFDRQHGLTTNCC